MTRLIWKNLTPPHCRQRDIVEKLIIPSVFPAEIIDFDQDAGKFASSLLTVPAARSRLFNASDDGKGSANTMLVQLLHPQKHNPSPYASDTEGYPILRSFKENWKRLLEHDLKISAAELAGLLPAYAVFEQLSKDTAAFSAVSLSPESFSDVTQIQSCVFPLLLASVDGTDENDLLLNRLAAISVIACVGYAWEHPKSYGKALLALSRLVFPACPLPPDGNDRDSALGDPDGRQYLAQIKRLMKREDYLSAGERCQELCQHNMTDAIRAGVLSCLADCCMHGCPLPEPFSSVDEIRQEELRCRNAYFSEDPCSILRSSVPAFSAEQGVCILNGSNPVSSIIQNTAPPGWTCTVMTENLTGALVPNRSQRLILIRESSDENIQDALSILDYIQKSVVLQQTALSDWKQTELYIRCSEEEAAPILDTALDRLYAASRHINPSDYDSGALIRAYLIDEPRRSADDLLLRYPLFYPLTAPGNSLPPNIHLVILSSNQSDLRYTKWLLKETFWALPQKNSAPLSQITVLSPCAQELFDQMNLEAPGLAQFSRLGDSAPSELNIDFDAPHITYDRVSFSSCTWLNGLAHLILKENLYFVIDPSSDTEGIRLGIQLREFVIRKVIHAGRIKNYSRYDAQIAVRFQNGSCARLAENLIVPKEDRQSEAWFWFNDYHLHTFGALEQIYSWDQLSGGVAEHLAQAMHIRYYRTTHPSDASASRQEPLCSYFNRLYNHDSSYAAAVSLPYRLFAAGIYDTENSGSALRSMEQLADRFERYLAQSSDPDPRKDPALRLYQYEHMRWCRFMLSRGWLPVQTGNVIQYMNAGVSSHSLQIAKLHPCICSWTALADLQCELHYQYYDNAVINRRFEAYFSPDRTFTYFQYLDADSILNTASVLRLAQHIADGAERDPLSNREG